MQKNNVPNRTVIGLIRQSSAITPPARCNHCKKFIYYFFDGLAINAPPKVASQGRHISMSLLMTITNPKTVSKE